MNMKINMNMYLYMCMSIDECVCVCTCRCMCKIAKHGPLIHTLTFFKPSNKTTVVSLTQILCLEVSHNWPQSGSLLLSATVS